MTNTIDLAIKLRLELELGIMTLSETEFNKLTDQIDSLKSTMSDLELDTYSERVNTEVYK